MSETEAIKYHLVNPNFSFDGGDTDCERELRDLPGSHKKLVTISAKLQVSQLPCLFTFHYSTLQYCWMRWMSQDTSILLGYKLSSSCFPWHPTSYILFRSSALSGSISFYSKSTSDLDGVWSIYAYFAEFFQLHQWMFPQLWWSYDNSLPLSRFGCSRHRASSCYTILPSTAWPMLPR